MDILQSTPDCVKSLDLMWADMGYTGPRVREALAYYDIQVEIVKRPRKWIRVHDSVTDLKAYCLERGIDITGGFKILKRRWVVERTFAWLNRFRRLAKDYELSILSSAAFIWAAMFRILSKRRDSV